MATWTTLSVLDWTTQRFTEAGISSARLEAQVLLAHVLGCSRVQLYTGFDKPLAEPELAGYRALIKRRLAGEPVAYLVGEHEFWGLPLHVEPSVLVPRPDTETVVEVARTWRDARRVLDLCTGSGCLAILAALRFPDATVDAADLSDDALAVAKKNVGEYKLGKRVHLLKSDLFRDLRGRRYDLIVSNPPYVKAASMRTLPDEYRKEPEMALASGSDGLDHARRILADARGHLNPGGRLMVEIGHNRKALEKGFPRLPFRWPRVAAGTGYVFTLERESLP